MKGLLQQHKQVAGRADRLKVDDQTCIVTLADTAIPAKMDHTFNKDGRKWRVSSLCDTFVIGTAIDATLDDHGEPSRSNDIIKVML